MIESVPLNNSPKDICEIKKQQVKKNRMKWETRFQYKIADSLCQKLKMFPWRCVKKQCNTCKYNADQITTSTDKIFKKNSNLHVE